MLNRDAIAAKVWRGRDPFAGFPKSLYELDTQGWGDYHPYLIDHMQPGTSPIIVEIGVWKGASTIAMSKQMQALGSTGTIIAIDTWLGAADHWTHGDWIDHLGLDHGYPSLNRKFMANIVNAGFERYVVPLPLDSINAAEVLKFHGIQADVIHIDAGHEYQSVISDIKAWWPILTPGGLLIGDDYYPKDGWPGVKQAFDEFFGPLGLLPLENVNGKCRLRKPA